MRIRFVYAGSDLDLSHSLGGYKDNLLYYGGSFVDGAGNRILQIGLWDEKKNRGHNFVYSLGKDSKVKFPLRLKFSCLKDEIVISECDDNWNKIGIAKE